MTAWILSSLLAAARPQPTQPPQCLRNRRFAFESRPCGGLSASVRIQPGVPEAGQVARDHRGAKKGPAVRCRSTAPP